jgi:hypothetical protein
MAEVIPMSANLQLSAEEEAKFSRISNLHLAAAIFFFIQLMAYSVVPVDIAVNATIITPVKPCEGPICGNELTYLGEMNPIFLIPLFVGLAFADHLACYLFCRFKEQRAKHWIFAVGANPLRWAEYSVSASCMALAISILTGISDVHLWLLIFVMHGVGMCMGLLMEMLPKVDVPDWPVRISTIKSICYWLGSVAIFTPWLVMCCYFFRAVGNDTPDFVPAAFLGTLVLFCTFGANSYAHNILGWYSFPQAEIIYIILSFTSKTFLAADVFGGLRAAEE